MYPPELKYTAEHEWVRIGDPEGTVRIGITEYAQQALGDIVFVTLPELGRVLRAGEPLGEVESTKSVSEVYAPIAGTVSGRNETLDAQPELINSDPYGEGWIVQLRPGVGDTHADPPHDPIARLLSAEGYQKLVDAL